MPLWNDDDKPLTQLEIDTILVFVEKTKRLEDFDPEYRIKIRSTWQFSAHKYSSKSGLDAPRTPGTLDVI